MTWRGLLFLFLPEYTTRSDKAPPRYQYRIPYFPLPPAPKKPGEKCSVDILSNPDYNEDKMLMKENVRELKPMQTPLVSIIVPVYNGAETIEKCLRRNQHQT